MSTNVTLQKLQSLGLLKSPVVIKIFKPEYAGTIDNIDYVHRKKFDEYSIDITKYKDTYYEIKDTSTSKVVGHLQSYQITHEQLQSTGGAKQKRHARSHWQSTGNHVDVRVRGKDGKIKIVQRMVYVNAKYPGQMRIAKIKDDKRVYVAFRAA